MIQVETKEKIIETKELQIYQNTFIYDNTIIQLDNIAQISVAPIDKKPIPTWAVICILIGVLVFSVNPLIAIVLVIAGGGYCAYWYNLNSRLGHYLALELNSGRRMYFRGKDDAFLKEIMRLMGDCMNRKNVGYTIHMQQATVENMQLGDHNTMV